MASESKVSVQLEAIAAVPGNGDSDLKFLFQLPSEGLALRGAAIVDGNPELQFEASPRVPVLTEEDVAVAFKLASEKDRPGFYYSKFPKGHPLGLSRFFTLYSPKWLRGTQTGELLADIDWKMKTMHIGATTNDDKTIFKPWAMSRNLQELGTHMDFPQDGLGPTIMSCDHARVQKNDFELRFPEEPKLKITDHSSSLYSKYITEVLPSVAYHDEPKFLKLQEIVKLTLAVEWLYKEKGIRVNQNWLDSHIPAPGKSGKNTRKRRKCRKSAPPPSSMVPTVSNFNCPSTDVRVGTQEAKANQVLRKDFGVRMLFGYFDFGGSEIVMFTEDGTKCQFPVKSLKMNHNLQLGMGLEMSLWSFLPVPLNFDMNAARKKCLEELKSLGTLPLPVNPSLPALRETSVEDEGDDETVRIKASSSCYPRPPVAFPPQESNATITMSVGESSAIFSSDPNDFNIPKIPGICDGFDSDVSSWDELIEKMSVPIPSVLLYPTFGEGVPMATGGVTTGSFPVREERLVSSSRNPERQAHGVYRRNGQTLSVVADRVSIHGVIQKFAPGTCIFDQISQKFRSTWTKGSPHAVLLVCKITNPSLEQVWTGYRDSLTSRRHPGESEEYFHGTSLSCDLLGSSSTLCKARSCGACGIASEGMKEECIGKHIDFQRFGKGYYLAPNSSKCHDYTEPNGRGHKAMLLCDVLPGNKFVTETMTRDRTSPPSGFDSIYGKVGTELNYPEIVLYDRRAILPRFIVVYQ